MSLLPESASFEERVQDYFLAVRGAGVVLAPLDVELLGEWSRAGIPYEVVVRGIARAVETARWDARPGEPVVKTLRACRRAVESEIKRHLHRIAGAEGNVVTGNGKKSASWEETRHRELVRTVRELGAADPSLGAVCARLLEGALGSIPPGPEELTRQETAVYFALLRALPFSERLSVWREATGFGAEETVALSWAARRLARRFRLTSAVRRRLP